MLDAISVNATQPAAAYVLNVEITHNHLYVPVRAGNRDLFFLLDTGAGTTLLNRRLVQELKLPLGPSFVVRGAGGGDLAGAMLATPVRITPGGHEGLAMLVAAMMPLEAIEAHAGRPIDGILGFDFISRHVLRLDYAARRISIYAPDGFAYTGAGAVVPLKIKNGHPHIVAAIALGPGQWVSGDFVVDIGSGMPLTLTKRFADAHHAVNALQQAFMAEGGPGVGAASRITVGRLPSLRIGPLDLASPVVAVFGEGGGVMSSGEYFDANIGAAILREFVVILDYPRSRLILER